MKITRSDTVLLDMSWDEALGSAINIGCQGDESSGIETLKMLLWDTRVREIASYRIVSGINAEHVYLILRTEDRVLLTMSSTATKVLVEVIRAGCQRSRAEYHLICGLSLPAMECLSAALSHGGVDEVPVEWGHWEMDAAELLDFATTAPIDQVVWVVTRSEINDVMRIVHGPRIICAHAAHAAYEAAKLRRSACERLPKDVRWSYDTKLALLTTKPQSMIGERPASELERVFLVAQATYDEEQPMIPNTVWWSHSDATNECSRLNRLHGGDTSYVVWPTWLER